MRLHRSAWPRGSADVRLSDQVEHHCSQERVHTHHLRVFAQEFDSNTVMRAAIERRERAMMSDNMILRYDVILDETVYAEDTSYRTRSRAASPG